MSKKPGPGAFLWLVPFYFLNLTLLWTNHTLSNLPVEVWNALWVPYNALVITALLLLARGNPTAYYSLLDLLALVWLALSFLGIGRFLGSWRKAAFVISLNVAVFEILLAVFDSPEFFIHVTGAQAVYHFAAWFTNADLLIVATVFALVTCRPWPFKRFRIRTPNHD